MLYISETKEKDNVPPSGPRGGWCHRTPTTVCASFRYPRLILAGNDGSGEAHLSEFGVPAESIKQSRGCTVSRMFRPSAGLAMTAPRKSRNTDKDGSESLDTK